MSYNFRTVMGQLSYKSWSKWSAGDFLVGKFQSSGEDNFGKANYKVEVIEASFDDEEVPAVGSIFTFNSSGALDKAMEEVTVGDVIKVIYKGEETLTKGKYKGKKFHSMEVLVANSSTSPKETGQDDLI
jgi:hypothetical protein